MNNREKNRKLTAAEKKRLEKFEKLRAEYAAEGFETKKLTIGLVRANVLALLLTLPVIICLLPFFLLRWERQLILPELLGTGKMLAPLIYLAVFLLLVVLHELIHGLTWALFTKKGLKAISFGFIAEYMTPYCSCDEALKRSGYILGSLMPTLVLGLAPALAAIGLGSEELFVLGAVMIMSGGGDLAISLKLLRFKAPGSEALYFDHPTQAGLVAFVK